MKKIMRLLFSIALLIFSFCVEATSFVGFWKVEKVLVGEEEVTPVAKWMKIDKDGTYLSGNGGLQHIKGSWTFDRSKKQLKLEENNGIKDPFGAFQISSTADRMEWRREEEGMLVVVNLLRIDEMPMSIADEIKGLWALTKVYKNGKDISESYSIGDNGYIMFRWDRRFVEQNASGEKNYAYWYINPHRSELRLVERNEDKLTEWWAAEITNNSLTLDGLRGDKKGLQFVYSRLTEFPK